MSWLFMYVGFATRREPVADPLLRYVVVECAISAGCACEVVGGGGSACEVPVNPVKGYQKETVFGRAGSCTALAPAWVGVGSVCEVVVVGAFPRRRNSSFAIASSPATAAPG